MKLLKFHRVGGVGLRMLKAHHEPCHTMRGSSEGTRHMPMPPATTEVWSAEPTATWVILTIPLWEKPHRDEEFSQRDLLGSIPTIVFAIY